MDCNNCMESLSAFIDGELTADENAGIQAHIDECAECTELCSQLRELTRLTGELSEPVPEEFRGRWQGALAEQRKPLGLNTRIFGSAAAAVLIIALVVGLYPTLVAPKNASSASEADVVAGIAPQAAEPADTAEAMAEEMLETAETTESADETESAETAEVTAEEMPETAEAAVSAEVTESAETTESAESAETPTAEAKTNAEQTGGKTRAITRETGAQETPAENGAPEEKSYADGVVHAANGAQSNTEAEAVEEAVLADAVMEEAPADEETAPKAAAADVQADAALFTAQADAMLDAAAVTGAAEKTDAVQSAESAPAESEASKAAAEMAARAVPLNFIEKITIWTNGADIDKVREDWANLLISHGITGESSIGVALAETLKNDMDALGYKLKYEETYIDMPFTAVIIEE